MKKMISLMCALLVLAGAHAVSYETQAGVTEVNCSRCIHSVFPSYVWYILTAEDQTQTFYFAILVDEGQEDIEAGRQYTLAEMIGEDSEWDDTEFNSHPYTQATFLKTTDADGKVKVEATVTDEDGASYHVVYDENRLPDLPAGGDYTITSVKSSFFPTDNDVFYALTDSVSQCAFYFDIIVASGKTDAESGRTYTTDDMIGISTYAEVRGYMIPFVSASFTKTVSDDYSYVIEAEAVDTAGHTWRLHYSNPAPRVRHLTFKSDSLVINQNVRSWQIFGYNADSSLFLSLYSVTENPVGQFNVTSFYAFNTYVVVAEGLDTVLYDVKEADITVSSPEAETYVLSGTLATVNMNDPQDLVFFTLDGKAYPPAPYVFPVTLSGTGYDLELMGEQWYFEGQSSEGLYFSINGLSRDVAGHYDGTKLDHYYTYVTPDGQSYYDLTEADLEVTYTDNTATVTGTMTVANEKDKSDSHQLTVNLSARYLVPTERHYAEDSETPYEGVFEAYIISDLYLDQYGALLVESANDKSQAVELLFYLPQGASTLVPGSYPVTATQGPQTVASSSGQTDMGGIAYSFVGSFGSRGAFEAPYWYIVDGSVTVAEDGSIVVDALNSYNQLIHCVLAAPAESIDSTIAGTRAVKRIENGRLIIEKNGVQYNAQGIVVE